MKKRSILVLGTTILLGAATVAFAQETAAAGAGRVEVGLTPAGGTFFNTGTHTGADFGTYALGGDMTFNVNKYVGIEGEVGAGLGVAQTINYHDVSFQNLKSPNTIAYNVDLALYRVGTIAPSCRT